MAEKRARRFMAAVPRFGTSKSPRPPNDQEASPYYWWWAYLRRSKRYIACCERGGAGALSKLYADFGDVRTENFKKWWTEGERGRNLFAEQHSLHGVIALDRKEDWLDGWDSASTLVLAIPLAWSKRALRKRVLALLRARHTRGPGRRALKGRESSSARYPLARNFNVSSLKKALAVYDAVEASRKAKDKKTYYQIGVELRLVPTAMPSRDEMRDDRRDADKVNAMTVAVSRNYQRAAKSISNVGKGVFP